MNRRPSLLIIVTIACLAALAVAVSSQTATPPSLALLGRDGRRVLPITLVNDQDFVALDDLAAAFQLTVREEAMGDVSVSYKGKTIVLTADQALASVSGRLISLPAPPTRAGRRWLVPVDFIGRALALVYDTRLDLRKSSRLLVIGDLRVPRVLVRYEPIGSGGRLTIDATPRVASTVTQDNDRLTIKFDADAVDVPNPPLAAQGPQSLVQAVRVVDATTLHGGARAALRRFQVLQPVGRCQRAVDHRSRLRRKRNRNRLAGSRGPDGGAALPSGRSAPTFHTITIDPGHGGDDEGTKGASGAREKDLTLTVARRVKVRDRGAAGASGAAHARRRSRRRSRQPDRPRQQQQGRPLHQPPRECFASRHRRPAPRSTTRSSTRPPPQSAVPDGGERVPAFGGGSRDIELVLWDLAQTRHVEESAAFADILEQQLRDRIPLVGHPVARAPLRVLESANMPAVLVEMGFLTNAEQEHLLTSDAFQATFVQATG